MVAAPSNVQDPRLAIAELREAAARRTAPNPTAPMMIFHLMTLFPRQARSQGACTRESMSSRLAARPLSAVPLAAWLSQKQAPVGKRRCRLRGRQRGPGRVNRAPLRNLAHESPPSPPTRRGLADSCGSRRDSPVSSHPCPRASRWLHRPWPEEARSKVRRRLRRLAIPNIAR
jgi:hypothetical protein